MKTFNRYAMRYDRAAANRCACHAYNYGSGVRTRARAHTPIVNQSHSSCRQTRNTDAPALCCHRHHFPHTVCRALCACVDDTIFIFLFFIFQLEAHIDRAHQPNTDLSTQFASIKEKSLESLRGFSGLNLTREARLHIT